MRLLIFLLFIFSLNSYAQMDLSYGSAMRTYPAIGAELNAEIGYSSLFWGKINKKKPFYGFIRPSLRLQSAAVINSYDLKIQFNPISFISIIRGFRHANSNYKGFSYYDCDSVRCKGDIKRDYTQIKIGLKAFGITAFANLVESNNYYSNPDGEDLPVAEYRFAVLADPERDHLYASRFVLGVDMLGGMLGVAADYAKFSSSGQTRNMDLLIYGSKFDKSKYIIGIGRFVSTHKKEGVIAIFKINTDYISGAKLF